MSTTNKNSIYRLLNCGEASHYGDWNYHNVSSPFARLHIVHAGSGSIIIGDKRYELHPGYVYLTPPFTLHNNECSGELKLSYIHLYESSHTLRRILEEFSTPFSVEAGVMEYAIFERIISLNRNLELAVYDPQKYADESTVTINRGSDEQTKESTLAINNLLLNTLLLPFVERGSHKDEASDQRVMAMTTYIRHNIYNTITIDDLCAVAHLSPTHTTRLFGRHTGRTPIEYINERKIETACLLLATRNISIQDIAYKLSFNNISYFNALFKRYTGSTPKGYRLAL
ncbi:MAG: AraC family transcriptional regulator [Rikenellaceae bacterium]